MLHQTQIPDPSCDNLRLVTTYGHQTLANKKKDSDGFAAIFRKSALGRLQQCTDAETAAGTFLLSYYLQHIAQE